MSQIGERVNSSNLTNANSLYSAAVSLLHPRFQLPTDGQVCPESLGFVIFLWFYTTSIQFRCLYMKYEICEQLSLLCWVLIYLCNCYEVILEWFGNLIKIQSFSKKNGGILTRQLENNNWTRSIFLQIVNHGLQFEFFCISQPDSNFLADFY